MAVPAKRIQAGRAARNEAINAVRAADAATALSFVCECPWPACTETVWLSREEYEHIRSTPEAFLVAPGHDVRPGRWCRVLADRGRYLVGERVPLGVAGVVGGGEGAGAPDLADDRISVV